MFRFALCIVLTSLVAGTATPRGSVTHEDSTDSTIHVVLRKPSEFFLSLLDECAASTWPNATEEKITGRRELFRRINQTSIDDLDALEDEPAGSLSQFRSCYEMPFEYHFKRCVASLEKDRASASFLKDLEGETIGSTVALIKNLDRFMQRVECPLGERKAMELIHCSVGLFFDLKSQ